MTDQHLEKAAELLRCIAPIVGDPCLAGRELLAACEAWLKADRLLQSHPDGEATDSDQHQGSQVGNNPAPAPSANIDGETTTGNAAALAAGNVTTSRDGPTPDCAVGPDAGRAISNPVDGGSPPPAESRCPKEVASYYGVLRCALATGHPGLHSHQPQCSCGQAEHSNFCNIVRWQADSNRDGDGGEGRVTDEQWPNVWLCIDRKSPCLYVGSDGSEEQARILADPGDEVAAYVPASKLEQAARELAEARRSLLAQDTNMTELLARESAYLAERDELKADIGLLSAALEREIELTEKRSAETEGLKQRLDQSQRMADALEDLAEGREIPCVVRGVFPGVYECRAEGLCVGCRARGIFEALSAKLATAEREIAMRDCDVEECMGQPERLLCATHAHSPPTAPLTRGELVAALIASADKHCDSSEERFRALADELEKGGKPDGSAQPAGRQWIPVSERMPESGSYVLFWVSDWLPTVTPGLGQFIHDDHGARFFDDTQLEGYDNTPKRYSSGVTHWQPLPAGPVSE